MSYNRNKGFGEIERPFNFAQLFLERTDKLFQAGNEARVEGNSFIWYRVLSTILTSISFRLTNEQIEEVEGELNKVTGKIKSAKNEQSEILYFEIEKLLNKIEKKIIALMYEYELYYPRYSKGDWEQDLLDEDV